MDLLTSLPSAHWGSSTLSFEEWPWFALTWFLPCLFPQQPSKTLRKPTSRPSTSARRTCSQRTPSALAWPSTSLSSSTRSSTLQSRPAHWPNRWGSLLLPAVNMEICTVSKNLPSKIFIDRVLALIKLINTKQIYVKTGSLHIDRVCRSVFWPPSSVWLGTCMKVFFGMCKYPTWPPPPPLISALPE